MLNDENIDLLLNRFPNVKLCYEKMIHNKVDSDFYVANPYGKKVFIWFTYLHKKNICVIMEITSKKSCNISNIYTINVRFDWKLSYGTIFYGTIVKNSKKVAICIEDILYYKSKNLKDEKFGERLMLLKNFFTNEIVQEKSKQKYVFALPIMDNNFQNFTEKIWKSPYTIYSVQCKNFNDTNKFQHYKFSEEQQKSYTSFIVKPEIQNDIYKLYCRNGKHGIKNKYDTGDINIDTIDFDDIDNDSSVTYYDIACIPDYKTSVMMNSLFRDIKENRNLDFLEESDSEEEFENTNIDKFVDLKKNYIMKCVFIPKFKKWKPISICDNTQNIFKIH